jgi:hypothetical protein
MLQVEHHGGDATQNETIHLGNFSDVIAVATGDGAAGDTYDFSGSPC